MPSPVQSNCDVHDTIANGQYGAVWSMGHTQQVCMRIVLLPSNVWQEFFGRSAFLRRRTSNTTFPVPFTTHFSSLNDFHSRETTLDAIIIKARYQKSQISSLPHNTYKQIKRGTLKSRRAASPFVRLVEGKERWEAPEQLRDVLP
ncbi:hypothetical protein TNCV_1461021 [Trichonephila clavipes]|nr:hypothetical protein TNCV_1461021 [Trichonephila clavipes]